MADRVTSLLGPMPRHFLEVCLLHPADALDRGRLKGITMWPSSQEHVATSAMTDSRPDNTDQAPSNRQEEWRSFLFFTVVMAPVLAVAIVGGFGFVVWMYQLVAGPPGS